MNQRETILCYSLPDICILELINIYNPITCIPYHFTTIAVMGVCAAQMPKARYSSNDLNNHHMCKHTLHTHFGQRIHSSLNKNFSQVWRGGCRYKPQIHSIALSHRSTLWGTSQLERCQTRSQPAISQNSVQEAVRGLGSISQLP